MIHVSDSFYVVGGYAGRYESNIGRFDMATRMWSKAGDLATARAGHNVIYDGQYLIVVGGFRGGNYEPDFCEKCSITNGRMSCTSQRPLLTDYSLYPELFLVQAGFCKEKP